ncbi:MAG: monovalent cation/H(+) antiporter subunit G [Rickettsiaceae bacterium H1]|nr:monovalent cation/H(+) antiporter subunit G [Rickettsiaceae bacterium H1]
MIISSLLIFLGLFFIVTSTVGIIRFSDLYNKFHPAGITDALGMPLIMLGLIVRNGLSVVSAKILLIVLALWITGSTASHIIAKSYYEKDKK